MYTDKPKLTADLLRPDCRGRWLDIFQYLCPGTFDEAIANLGSHVTCPFHGGKEDFRFTKKPTKKGDSTENCGVAMCTCGSYTDGFAVLRRALGVPFFEVLKRVDEYLHGDAPVQAPPPVVITTDKVRSDAEVLEKVHKLWGARKPFSPATTPYYVERGISPIILKDIQDVGVLPSLGYYKKEDGKLVREASFPAILAAMRNAKGEVIAVHRTWLSKNRKDKAPVSGKVKKLSETPGAAGAAIRLYDATGSSILGLTEGVETGCGVRQLACGGYWPEFGRIPVWAAYSERNIRSFVVPEFLLPTLRKIVVFADMDENWTGIKAALEFKARMAIEHPDIEVIIKVPHVFGWDWLDVLISL
jgi:putative DNA primase/helicase